MHIAITNWKKFNPRTELKSMPWFRVSSGIVHDPKLFGLSPAQKWVWVCLLGFAAEKNSESFDLEIEYACHATGASPEDIFSTIQHCIQKGLVVADPAQARYESGPDTVHECTCTDVTNVTDVTDETDETDETVCRGSRPRRAYTGARATKPAEKKTAEKKTAEKSGGSVVWDAYANAYEDRYKKQPIRNAKANALCKQLCDRLGVELAPDVVRFYLSHNGAWYVSKLHQLEYAVKDAEKLATEASIGAQMTAPFARKVEANQANAQIVRSVLDRRKNL